MESRDIEVVRNTHRSILADVNNNLKDVEKGGLTRSVDPMKKKRLKISDFEFMRVLGAGCFSKVFIVRHIQSNKYFAAKRYLRVASGPQHDHARNECQTLSMVRHPFILTYYGAMKDQKYGYIVTDAILGGDLFSQMQYIKERDAKFYTVQIILALSYLHSFEIVYRDLKPENVLLCQNGYIKLADFGFSKIIHDKSYTLCGTPEYMAPEILTKKGHGCSIDWWSLGVLIYEMITKCSPFTYEGTDQMSVFRCILRGKVNCHHKRLTPPVASLIKHLLEKNPEKRFGASGIRTLVNHVWFAGINWKDIFNRRVKAPYLPDVVNMCELGESLSLSDEVGDGSELTAAEPFKEW